MLRIFWLFISLAFLGSQVLAADSASSLFPFVLPWDDATSGVTNVNSLLEKPAGKHGFVTSRNGHLYAGDKRIRFFGVNLCFGACFPSHADAEKVAARLGKFGVNCVRFHHMDSRVTPDGIMGSDKRTLDPEQLDRLDYLIWQLKKNGIYSDLNLHVSRVYPDFRKWKGMPDYFKGVDNFFPAMIDLQHEYARDLLTHRNPYTDTRYIDEPAVAFIEINNENGLFFEWWREALDDMPDIYSDELQSQWNTWLKRRYTSIENLKKAWCPPENPSGPEMLSNGKLTDGMHSWNLVCSGPAQASGEAVPDSQNGAQVLHVKVNQPGEIGWHVLVYQKGLELEKGKPYTFTFRARADSQRRILINVTQAESPWSQIWSSPVRLENEWQDFQLSFVPSKSEKNARIMLSDLSRPDAQFWFTDLSLKNGQMAKLPGDLELGRIDILKRSESAGRTIEHYRDWVRFLWDTEEAYWTGMSKYIKDELKAKALIIGTQANFSPSPIQARLDVVDAHAYWKHPQFPGKPWDRENWTVQNAPMTAADDGGTLPPLGLARVADKPCVITEYNHPAPNTYSSEAFLLLAAYASMQDWDGIFAFDYSARRDEWDLQHFSSYLSINQHPTKMTTLPAAVTMFMRGDVRTPDRKITVHCTREEAVDASFTAGPRIGAGLFGVENTAALDTLTAVSFDGRGIDRKGGESRASELLWHPESRKIVTVNSKLSKAFVGSVTGGSVDLGGVGIAPGRNLQDWAAITLTVMKGNGFDSKASILVTATGYCENTGMGWKDEKKNSVGSNWGMAPSLVEGIPASITLPVRLERGKAWSLDECGRRKEQVPVENTGGKASIKIGPQYRTLWYEVEISD